MLTALEELVLPTGGGGGAVNLPKLIAEGNELLAIGPFGKYLFGQTCVGRHQDAQRLAACWNACLGITTETLEAGVVVVPVELLRSIRYLLGKVAEQDALTSYDRRTAKELAGELGNVLHHPRQSGRRRC